MLYYLNSNKLKFDIGKTKRMMFSRNVETLRNSSHAGLKKAPESTPGRCPKGACRFWAPKTDGHDPSTRFLVTEIGGHQVLVGFEHRPGVDLSAILSPAHMLLEFFVKVKMKLKEYYIHLDLWV